MIAEHSTKTEFLKLYHAYKSPGEQAVKSEITCPGTKQLG